MDDEEFEKRFAALSSTTTITDSPSDIDLLNDLTLLRRRAYKRSRKRTTLPFYNNPKQTTIHQLYRPRPSLSNPKRRRRQRSRFPPSTSRERIKTRGEIRDARISFHQGSKKSGDTSAKPIHPFSKITTRENTIEGKLVLGSPPAPISLQDIQE
jgi:hypothetical protein